MTAVLIGSFTRAHATGLFCTWNSRY